LDEYPPEIEKEIKKEIDKEIEIEKHRAPSPISIKKV
jgi:hypothetical protein